MKRAEFFSSAESINSSKRALHLAVDALMLVIFYPQIKTPHASIVFALNSLLKIKVFWDITDVSEELLRNVSN
jgi:hypothetical protein